MNNETRKMGRDNAWYGAQLWQVGSLLSAWFALECACRAGALAEEPYATDALPEIQRFLLGRSTWSQLDEVREQVDGRIWATRRNNILGKMALRVIRFATFADEPMKHIACAEYARRLDDRSAKPLTAGIRESVLQEQRLQDFLGYGEIDAIKQLQRAFRRQRDLTALGMLADALQDEGFTPPA